MHELPTTIHMQIDLENLLREFFSANPEVKVEPYDEITIFASGDIYSSGLYKIIMDDRRTLTNGSFQWVTKDNRKNECRIEITINGGEFIEIWSMSFGTEIN